MPTPFHLACHAASPDEARAFHGGILGCREGSSTEGWVGFDVFGHQISLHPETPFATTDTGEVGDHMGPMPHLGLILHLPDWQALADRPTGRPGPASGPFCRLGSGSGGSRESSGRCSSAIPAATRSRGWGLRGWRGRVGPKPDPRDFSGCARRLGG